MSTLISLHLEDIRCQFILLFLLEPNQYPFVYQEAQASEAETPRTAFLPLDPSGHL